MRKDAIGQHQVSENKGRARPAAPTSEPRRGATCASRHGAGCAAYESAIDAPWFELPLRSSGWCEEGAPPNNAMAPEEDRSKCASEGSSCRQPPLACGRNRRSMHGRSELGCMGACMRCSFCCTSARLRRCVGNTVALERLLIDRATAQEEGDTARAGEDVWPANAADRM